MRRGRRGRRLTTAANIAIGIQELGGREEPYPSKTSSPSSMRLVDSAAAHFAASGAPRCLPQAASAQSRHCGRRHSRRHCTSRVEGTRPTPEIIREETSAIERSNASRAMLKVHPPPAPQLATPSRTSVPLASISAVTPFAAASVRPFGPRKVAKKGASSIASVKTCAPTEVSRSTAVDNNASWPCVTLGGR